MIKEITGCNPKEYFRLVRVLTKKGFQKEELQDGVFKYTSPNKKLELELYINGNTVIIDSQANKDRLSGLAKKIAAVVGGKSRAIDERLWTSEYYTWLTH